MKNLLFATVIVASSLAHAVGTIDAAVMKFKVYKMAVSTSTTCSSPITVFTDPVGSEQDMIAGANFGRGRLSPGTYPFVMIEMSKIIKTRSATTSGSCNAATEFSDVICNDAGQLSQTIDGVAVTCSGGAGNDQHVTLYITTLSAGTNGNRALLPPTSSSDTLSGLALTAPFVVTTSRAGNLNVNFHNFLGGTGPSCETFAPGFTFN